MPIANGFNPSFPNVKSFTANLSQSAATYDLCTAAGNVLIKSTGIFIVTAAGGLTSVSVSSNNTTADVVLASTILATLTGGKNLTPVSLPFILADTKKIQYTIVGTGNAGSILFMFEIAGGILL